VTLETENSGLMKFPKGFSNGITLLYDTTKTVVGNYSSEQPSVVVDDVSGLEIGFNVTAQSGKISAGTTIADIDVVNNVVIFNNNLIGGITDGSTIEFTSAVVKIKVIEAWTYNGGATVFVHYLGEFES
jgi:hypothetical protein